MGEYTQEQMELATKIAVDWFGPMLDKVEELIDKLSAMAGVEAEIVGHDPPDTTKIISESALKTWKKDGR